MSKQLYEEALADVKKLKEIAEDNAKRAILEAVTPRIKDLIENQLLGEDKEEMSDDELLLDDMPTSEMGMSDPAAAAISLPDEEGKVTLDLSALATPVSSDQVALSMDDEAAVDALMPVEKSSVVKAESFVISIEKKIQKFTNASSVIKETKNYFVGIVSTISEIENMYSALQRQKDSLAKNSLLKRLKECHISLKNLMEQEMNTMKRFSLNEEDITLKLKMPDEANVDPDDVEIELISGDEGEESEEGEEGLELSDEEGGDEGESEEASESGESVPEEGGDEGEKMESRKLNDDLVVEIDENMLRREISRMRALREASEEADVQAWGHGPGEVSDEFEDEDMGDPFVDVDLSEADAHATDEMVDEMDEKDMPEEAYEADEAAAHEVDEMEEKMHMEGPTKKVPSERDAHPAVQSNRQANLPEAIKRKLAAEARLQFEAKKKASQAKKQGMKAERQAKMSKTEQQKKQAKKQSSRMKEAYNYYAQQFNESVARSKKLNGMLAEATARQEPTTNGRSQRLAEETVTLREKLAESNLFNAKLLYTNKLLQNESLTKRQKAEVIERLDEAQNIREVKLVYESLVKALQGGSTGRTVTESTSRGVVGSSSRPARPAATTTATLNEGYEAERWAKLAGIIK